jgi:septal ring factor EnvC (AmiA/AmiB activator)
MRTYVAALALLAALVTAIHADPAEYAWRAEMERAARKAAEDKKAAADEARREAEARRSGEFAQAVMVNNRAINPITGKVVGTFKGGSTHLAARPGALDN